MERIANLEMKLRKNFCASRTKMEREVLTYIREQEDLAHEKVEDIARNIIALAISVCPRRN